jgi:hypothetical protein
VQQSDQSFRADSFTINQGLCGAPLWYREKKKGGLRLHKINDDIAIGVAVGFVVSLYSLQLFVFCGWLQPYMFRI